MVDQPTPKVRTQNHRTLLSLNQSSNTEDFQPVDKNKKQIIKMIRNTTQNSNSKLFQDISIQLKPRLIQQNMPQINNREVQWTPIQPDETKKIINCTGQFIIPSNNDLQQNKKKFSLHYILNLTNSSEIRQIKKIVLKNQNLFIFEPDFPLTNLIYLNISHNYLNNLSGITQIYSLKELDIDFNYIQDLSPLQKLEDLLKLKANSNQICNILPLQQLQNLQNIQLSKNNIQDFDQTIQVLQQLPLLKELMLQDNPSTQSRFSYKYDVLWALKLIKLDNEKITSKEFQLSRAFNLSNEKMLKSNSGKEDEFNNTLRTITNHSNSQHKSQLSVQKSKEYDKKISEKDYQIYQLRQQLQQTTIEKQQYMKQCEKVMIENSELTLNIENLQKQIEELTFENALAGDQQTENFDLRRKINAYEQTLVYQNSDEGELKQQVYYLNKRIQDIEYENSQCKELIRFYEQKFQN